MQDATIGYTIEFEINEGEQEAFEQKSSEMTRLVEKTEPGTVMYEWFVAEDGRSARICEWFTDSEAGIAHLTGRAATELLPEFLELGEITNIEVYGTPNEKLGEILSDFPVSGTFGHLDGFTR